MSPHQTMGIVLGRPAGTKLNTQSVEIEMETGILRPGRRSALDIAGVYFTRRPCCRNFQSQSSQG